MSLSELSGSELAEVARKQVQKVKEQNDRFDSVMDRLLAVVEEQTRRLDERDG